VTFGAGIPRRGALIYIQFSECKEYRMAGRYADATARFKALAHPIRLQILDMLRGGEICVCHMEASLGKRQAYISQQLIVLRDAGLVQSRKDGLSVYYRLVDDVTADLLETALGPADEDALQVLTSCPCPHCAEAVTEAITTK
jgi:DNA-binding transcriptional ArsR family regulator